MPALKYLRSSLVFFDPPFGYGLEVWDSPDKIWDLKYWLLVLQSLRAILADGATLAAFGDCFNVLPPLMQAIQAFNAKSSQKGSPLFVSPVQFCFQKTNHPHKGTAGYSQSVENVFLFFYGAPPKIKKMAFELGGNLLSAARVAGDRVIKGPDGTQLNPCQKNPLLLRALIENHATPNTIVLDLTAGSFSSYLACYLSTLPLHWAGCDIAENALSMWDHIQDSLLTSVEVDADPNKTWFSKFVCGTNFIYLF